MELCLYVPGETDQQSTGVLCEDNLKIKIINNNGATLHQDESSLDKREKRRKITFVYSICSVAIEKKLWEFNKRRRILKLKV